MIVESLIQAFKTNNIKGVQKMIRQNRRVIQSMDVEATVDIETDKLKKLCDIGEKHGGASKTSGAGGGDCGITIINTIIDKQLIYDEWIAQGIKPLKFRFIMDSNKNSLY